jgi:hypothetical protein
MQLLNSTLDIAPANYDKPTPKWLKVIADVLVFIVMAYNFFEAFIATMPDFPHKTWVIYGVSGLILAFKFVTKLITTKHPDLKLNDSTV